MVDQVELRRILTGSEIARLHKAKCDTGPELYDLVHESLYHLRLDDGAKAYHERALIALRKVRTPTTPERSDD